MLPVIACARSQTHANAGHSKNRSLKSKSGHRYTSRNQSPVPMQISPDIHVGPQKTPQRSSRSQSPAVIHASPSSSMPSSPARTHSQSPGRQNPRGTAPVPSSASPHLAEPSPGTAAQVCCPLDYTQHTASPRLCMSWVFFTSTLCHDSLSLSSFANHVLDAARLPAMHHTMHMCSPLGKGLLCLCSTVFSKPAKWAQIPL